MSAKLYTLSSGPDPDDDLISLIVSGDQTAFKALIDRHFKTLLSIAAHMLGDPFQAEDVTQSVFFKTWKMLPNWTPGKAKLKTWMRRVTVNECLDILRKNTPLYMDQLPESVDETLLPTEALIQADIQKTVRRALSGLPDTQKAALIMSYYHDVGRQEGAEILGLTISAYESLLARARRTLKTQLQTLNIAASDKPISDTLSIAGGSS